jgi:hypothetical protein
MFAESAEMGRIVEPESRVSVVRMVLVYRMACCNAHVFCMWPYAGFDAYSLLLHVCMDDAVLFLFAGRKGKAPLLQRDGTERSAFWVAKMIRGLN